MLANIEHRGPQRKPTRADVGQAWQCLREAAKGGNIQAAALLIALAENKPVIDGRAFLPATTDNQASQ